MPQSVGTGQSKHGTSVRAEQVVHGSDMGECDAACVCVRVFLIFREGILATLSYSGILQPIEDLRFRTKKLAIYHTLTRYLLPTYSVLFQKHQQALQVRSSMGGGGRGMSQTRHTTPRARHARTPPRIHTYAYKRTPVHAA